jgi:hypothetical protein
MRRKHSPPTPAATTYRIQVQGCIPPRWSDWYGGLSVTEEQDAAGQPVTTLIGPVPDQPGLRGIVNKLWDLNLTLIGIERLPVTAGKEPDDERKRTQPASGQ